MNPSPADRQKAYWNQEVDRFDAIYSGAKGRLGRLLDRCFRHDMFERLDYTMSQAKPIEGRSFLDVGCGTGRYALALAERGARRVVGLDVSDKMIAICRERATRAGLTDRVVFHTAALPDYRPDDAFDACLAIGLFDYVADPLPLLTRMRASVRDAVILSFPRRWTWRAPLRRMRLSFRGCYVRFYGRRETEDLLRAAGFRQWDLRRVGKLYCVTARVSRA